MELHKKHRPTDLADVAGNSKMVKMIGAKLKAGEWPHVSILAGPTGCGKTTLAWIIARHLTGGVDTGIRETNSASVRGISTVEETEELVRARPLGGKVWVLILDEVVQLPTLTQQAYLKLLENVPEHVYFILCTTDTTKLIRTFLTRCFTVNLEALTKAAVEKVVTRVLKLEGREVSLEVLAAVVMAANGSARDALQLLGAALSYTDAADQLQMVQRGVYKEDKKTEFLVNALLNRREWRQVADIIDAVPEAKIESLRYQVLAYCCKLMKTPKAEQAYKIIVAFEDSFAGGKASLWAAAYRLCFKVG